MSAFAGDSAKYDIEAALLEDCATVRVSDTHEDVDYIIQIERSASGSGRLTQEELEEQAQREAASPDVYLKERIEERLKRSVDSYGFRVVEANNSDLVLVDNSGEPDAFAADACRAIMEHARR